ncbi:hypothetical protein MHF_0387 [Mycoplasma haemofelis Ohio2]|uniref:Uncharacterized protein n=1 Tax=Mycoplasma haemofelis (strain Ohio2) TaxID=859194 RepID=F6FH58_MYCHI|nr:hypothetical protein MHF_0387 [Mycoplasma haemofelis Ohio2]
MGAAATGGGIYYALSDDQSSTSISELFKSEKGLKLMTSADDPKWNEAWGNYRKDHKVGNSESYKDEDKWRISNWKEKKGEGSAFEEFKKECDKRSKVKVKDTNQPEYQDVKKYCSRPKKISELLSENKGRTLLDKSGDSTLWNKSWEEYKKTNVQSKTGTAVTYKAQDTWGVEGWSSKQSLTDAPAEYKTKCETKLDSYIDPNKLTQDETFKQVVSWCTK